MVKSRCAHRLSGSLQIISLTLFWKLLPNTSKYEHFQVYIQEESQKRCSNRDQVRLYLLALHLCEKFYSPFSPLHHSLISISSLH